MVGTTISPYPVIERISYGHFESPTLVALGNAAACAHWFHDYHGSNTFVPSTLKLCLG